MVFELQRQLKEIESLQTDIESEFDRSKSVLQALVDLLSNPESQIERTGPVLNDERVDADESANTDDEVSGT
jgi:hypothetical protein